MATLASAGPASAAVIVPNAFGDGAMTGNCTLREAVRAASTDAAVDGCAAGSGLDLIVLAGGTYSLQTPPGPSEHDPLTGDLVADDPDGDLVAILGSPAGTTIDAGGTHRVLTALSPVLFSGLELTGGDARTGAGMGFSTRGGALDAPGPDPASIVLLSSTVSASHAGGGGGGAIGSAGDVGLAASTLFGNSATTPGSGPTAGGAVRAAGLLRIIDSTIAGNAVDTGDETGAGGGFSVGGTLDLRRSIVADNTVEGAMADCDTGGVMRQSLGGNLIRSVPPGCDLGSTSADTIGGAPGFAGTLHRHAGPVRTLAIAPSGPAHDAAGNGCSGSLDQRGIPRPQQGACDAGAYEITFCGPLLVTRIGTAAADVLTGGAGADSILGFAGDDRLLGAAGNDALCGGPGTDTLEGGAGADLLAGGDDVDIAEYSSRSGALTVTLNGIADDGEAGEGDRVLTESVSGGAGNDTISGDSNANGFLGAAGADTLRGAEGNDTLLGGPGDDRVEGGSGNDVLGGGSGADTIFGADGNDFMQGFAGEDRMLGGAGRDEIEGGDADDLVDGGPGRDLLFGEAGNDVLRGGSGSDRMYGGPGRDVFRCGPGRDTVFADRRDRVGRDCERVRR